MIRLVNSHRRVRSRWTAPLFFGGGIVLVLCACCGTWDMMIGF